MELYTYVIHSFIQVRCTRQRSSEKQTNTQVTWLWDANNVLMEDGCYCAPSGPANQVRPYGRSMRFGTFWSVLLWTQLPLAYWTTCTMAKRLPPFRSLTWALEICLALSAFLFPNQPQGPGQSGADVLCVPIEHRALRIDLNYVNPIKRLNGYQSHIFTLLLSLRQGLTV